MPRAGRRVVLTEAWVEVDVDVDGPPSADEAAHEQCRGQQATGELGDHPFGERQATAVGVPRRFEGRGAGPVAARSPSARLAGPTRKVPAPRPADEAAEQRLAVEMGRAQPIDRPV